MYVLNVWTYSNTTASFEYFLDGRYSPVKQAEEKNSPLSFSEDFINVLLIFFFKTSSQLKCPTFYFTLDINHNVSLVVPIT